MMAPRSHLGIKTLLCAAMLLASPAAADARGGGGGHGGGGGSWHGGGFHGGGGGGFHGGRGFYGRGYGRYGYAGFGFYGFGYPYWGDPYWYGWDYSDYGYPYGYPSGYDPSAVAAQSSTAPAAQSYWYYCRSANRYYPYVQSCPEGWQKVLPTPPANSQQSLNAPTTSARHPLAESGSAE
jgi:hypothetical protein